MSPEQIDLLPPERRRVRRQSYFLRLAVLVVASALSLVVVAGVLLVPTYVFLTDAAHIKQARLAHITSTLSSADEAALAARLAALSAAATTLIALAKGPSASVVIREALVVPRPGITLTGFSYTAPGTKSGLLTIMGTSANRNDLRAYQLALMGEPGFASVDLPVSSYAKDSDIPFTMTAKLASPSSP